MYKVILFATDLSEDTDYLINKVREIRGYTGAQLHLVHVVEPLPGYSYAYLGVEDIEGQLVTESKTSALKIAEKLNIDEKSIFIELGPTKTKILDVADEVKADLIICGSHGRHGLSLLLGSTANAVIHGAKCDVLTVRIPDENK